MAFGYPVALEVEGRRCVVIGGGSVGEHKAAALLDAGARVTVIAERFTERLEEMASRGELELLRRGYREGDLDGAFLAIAATDDREVNGRIFAEADRDRVLLNAVDDVEHCHFAAPSVVRRGDLTIAISTGGKAPALAKRVRQRLEQEFGPELGVLVDLLGEARAEALPARKVDFDTWARRWQVALDHGLLEMVRAGELDEVKRTVARALAGERREGGAAAARDAPPRREEPRYGRVSIVGAGPGDPRLLTLRGREALDAADVVVYDRLVDPSLVDGRDAIFVGKQAGRHYVPQSEINALLVRLALEGNNVVRLKGGDPFVFGRGSEEAQALAAAGIDFEIVPGVSSALAAPAAAGIPVTDRRLASSVALVTGHCAQGKSLDWRALARSAETIVVLMGLARLGEIATELIAGGLDPETPSAVIAAATTPDQRVVTAALRDLPRAVRDDGVGGPATIVIGDVVSLRATSPRDEAKELEDLGAPRGALGAEELVSSG